MEKFIHEFGVDVRLLLAQLLNFAILVFILGYFIYKPILNALDNRRKKIEEGVEFSNKAKQELESVETLKKESLRKAESKSLEIVKEAEGVAKKAGAEILASAEVDKEKIIHSGKVKLAQDKKKIEEGFYQEASGVVQEALKKVLMKKHFEAEEKELIDATLKELHTSK